MSLDTQFSAFLKFLLIPFMPVIKEQWYTSNLLKVSQCRLCCTIKLPKLSEICGQWVNQYIKSKAFCPPIELVQWITQKLVGLSLKCQWPVFLSFCNILSSLQFNKKTRIKSSHTPSDLVLFDVGRCCYYSLLTVPSEQIFPPGLLKVLTNLGVKAKWTGPKSRPRPRNNL
jgi:hypothetical protein